MRKSSRPPTIDMEAAILDALPARVALLDTNGFITSVNSAWQRFGNANGLHRPGHDIGVDYLAICDQARGKDAILAHRAAAGIRAVLEARVPSFSMEYPCHSPEEQCWFVMTATPLADVKHDGVLVMHQSVTAQRIAEAGQRNLVRQLEVERARLVAAQRVAKIGSWETDPATLVTIWSEETHRIHETDPSLFDPDHQGFLALVHPEDRNAVESAFSQSLNHRHANAISHRLLLADGRIKHVEERWQVFFNAQGKAIRAVGTCQDMTERKQSELKIERLNRVNAVLSQINALTVRVHDRDELFREACRIAVDVGGFRMGMIAMVDQVNGKIVPIATAGKEEALLQAMRNVLASDEKAPTTMAAKAIRDKSAIVSNDVANDPRAVLREDYARSGVRSLAVLPLIVADEGVGILALYAAEMDFFHEEEMKLLMGLANDVAFAIDHIQKEARLTYLAYYDATTGLANRALFLERLQDMLLSSQSGSWGCAVFVLDIVRFRIINDTFGQKAGDDLLKQIAERLVQAGGGEAIRFARLGADRFVIFASDMVNAEQVAPYVQQRLSATFSRPFRVRYNDLRISVKVGIALSPGDGDDAETLLRNAEVALKKAKAAGEPYLFFNRTMIERVAERLSLENRLRQALDKEQFVLHFQPKVNLVTRELTGAEALIRWNDPRTGLVLPGMFIPILEESGLIHDVGRWAMRKAVVDNRRWRSMGLKGVRVAVNVSPLQLRSRGLIAEIEQALGDDAHSAGCLELEITESLVMEDVEHSIEVLRVIRAMGVTIAIDDFGTGFSSLSYLAKLPMDTLKIDRAFVNDMTATPQGLALVSTIITLAHSLQHKVVAEGVETHAQRELLQSLGCDEMQGFLISKPLPTEDFETLFLSPKTSD